MDRLGAVILAAGCSSRMGAYKPLLRVGGETMIGRVVAAMKAAGANPVVVVTGHNRELLEAHLGESGVRFVHNAHFRETQMLDSLLLGMGALEGQCEHLLVSPADVPLVRPETLERLLGARGDFVRPVCGGKGGHPVLLKADLLPVLRQYRGPGGLRGAVEAAGLELREVAVDDRGVLLDNDTPADFSRTLQHYEDSRKEG